MFEHPLNLVAEGGRSACSRGHYLDPCPGIRDRGSNSARILRQAPDRPADALVRAMARPGTAGAGSGWPNSADPSRSVPRANPPCHHQKCARPRLRPLDLMGPGNGILRTETGGRLQAQNAGERPEFGSQTATRLANRPELRGFLTTRKPRRFAGTAWWAMQGSN